MRPVHIRKPVNVPDYVEEDEQCAHLGPKRGNFISPQLAMSGTASVNKSEPERKHSGLVIKNGEFMSNTASPLMFYQQTLNPEYDDHHLRKNSSLIMSRDRTDSISAFKKFEKAGQHLHDQPGFESPRMSPMLSSTALGGLSYGGLQSLGMPNSGLQNILL